MHLILKSTTKNNKTGPAKIRPVTLRGVSIRKTKVNPRVTRGLRVLLDKTLFVNPVVVAEIRMIPFYF